MNRKTSPVKPFRLQSFFHNLFLILLLSCHGISGSLFGQEAGILKPGTVTFDDPFENLNLHSPDFLSVSTSELNRYYSNILLEDSHGFIWMAWQGDLVKYDGYQLTKFNQVPVGTNGLDAYWVQTMAEDEHGYLWMGCTGRQGLYRYDPREETFERFPRNKKDPQEISDDPIWSVSTDRKGSVWIATTDAGNGLYRYDYGSDTFEVFRDEAGNPTALPSNNVDFVYADNQSNVWLNTARRTRYERPGGLYHYNKKDRKFRQVLFSTPGIDQDGAMADWVQEDSEGNLWMTVIFMKEREEISYNLLKVPFPWEDCFQQITDTSIIIERFNTYPAEWYHRAFDIDPQDHLWVAGSEMGIFRLEPSTGQFNQCIPENFRKAPYRWFNRVLCTRSGAVWYGYNIGISKYVPWQRKFAFFSPAFFQQKTGKQEEVHSIYEAEDGILWIGLKNRLMKYDPGTLETRSYTPLDMENAMTSTLRNRNNPLKVIEPGEDGELLVSGDNTLFIFNISEERFDKIYFPEEQWFKFGYVVESNHLFRDRNGVIWIGVGPGCIQVDLQQKEARYLYGLRDEHFLGGTTIAIAEDHLGMIWLATRLGLNRFDPLTGKVDHLVFNPGLPGGLASRNISSMILDRAGNMWIGHETKGISYLNSAQIEDPDLHPGSLSFSYLSLEDGLPDLHIHDLVEDRSGNIWIASRTGLTRFDPVTGEIEVFTETDGIEILPFSSKFHLNTGTGRIYIGGMNGMISFHPDSIPVNTYIPPVVITGLKLHDQPVAISDSTVLEQSITYTEKLVLSHEENFLEFTFAALDYTNPSKNQYRYFMKGVDPDTVYAGTDRTAEYRDMKPGRYTFWVTGSNNDGVWNPDGTTLEIRIRPPWYRSSLANGSYVLLLLLIIAGIIWWRTSRLQKEKFLLEAEVAKRTSELRQKNKQIVEMEQIKTRFFTDVSHEIRTPLTLISGPLENLMQKDHPDPDTSHWLGLIRRNSNRLLHLVNQLLDISKLDAGQMKLVLEKGDIIRHLNVLVQEYQSLADSRKINFISDIPEKELYTWYDRDKMEKITTNLLSNAFKYTPDQGTITFRVRILDSTPGGADGRIRILVADTGPGIPESEREKIFKRFYRSEEKIQEEAAGTGIGLSLTRELITLMKGNIHIRSSEGKGTVFITDLPVGKNHLAESEYVLKETGKAPPHESREPVTEETGDHETFTGSERSSLPEVLVVEDNAELRTYISENLQAGFRIIEADGGMQGLESALARTPDLVISDVMMPGMDGVELCGKLKADERTSHIPVILLTAKSTRADRIEGLEMGADDYISKPFDMNELKVRIRNLLEQREKLRQKYSGMVGLDWDKVSVTTLDEKFLKKIAEVISERMHDSEFNVNVLQEEMAMSRQNLFRKLKALTGDTPSGLIRILRLKTAAAMLEKGNESITRIALNTGFSDSSIFAQLFKKEFGMSPGEYKKKEGRDLNKSKNAEE